MSALDDTIDLTLYGCPMHYIKAREALSKIALKQQLSFKVNNGEAVEEVMKSLRHDGQQCEIVATDTLTTNIRVVKKMSQISEALEQKIDAVKQILAEIVSEYDSVTFASSYGAEDMVLMDLICKFAPEIEIFTLDTGRLPKETYEVMQEAKAHYNREVKVYFPDAADVEAYVTEKGPNAFYDSVELRKECCAIRKVTPLKRALAGKKAWLTGMRRSQAVTRSELPVSEWDETFALQKFSPLTDWSNGNVKAYIKAFDVPYNKLHDQGVVSIGCAPCTRAITAGEDIRAGRWWWENPESKECGLHVKANK